MYPIANFMNEICRIGGSMLEAAFDWLEKHLGLWVIPFVPFIVLMAVPGGIALALYQFGVR